MGMNESASGTSLGKRALAFVVLLVVAWVLLKVVIGVVNFAPKRIADFTSEALVLGVADDNGHVVLLSPDFAVPLGSNVY